MQYTTYPRLWLRPPTLFYQNFKDTFVCNTQLALGLSIRFWCCFIRISMILLDAIHNCRRHSVWKHSGCVIRISKILLDAIHNLIVSLFPCWEVVLSGFQWTICLQKYRKNRKYANLHEIILIFQKKALPLQQQIWRIYTIRIIPLCKHSEWHASVALFLPLTHLFEHFLGISSQKFA